VWLVSARSIWLGRLGVLAAYLAVVLHFFIFIYAVSALWGWYSLDLVFLTILLAKIIDDRKEIYKVIVLKIYEVSFQKYFAFYRVILVMIAVIFNVIFFITYLFGIYSPPFGDHPLR
jgi:hypothetical protein